MPRIALVDPLLTMSMPKELTAATGLDALTHAIEAYVSVKAQPMTDLMAISAMELLAEFLPRAWSNPEDFEARTMTLLGALQAGIAFSNASTGLVHGMARPLGAHFHVPHGLSNAALLAVVMEFCLQSNPERYARIARAIGVDTTGLSPLEAAQAGTKKVKELVVALELPTLKGLGLRRRSLSNRQVKWPRMPSPAGLRRIALGSQNPKKSLICIWQPTDKIHSLADSQIYG